MCGAERQSSSMIQGRVIQGRVWVQHSWLSKNIFSNITPWGSRKKINEWIASLENLTTKKMSSGPSLYYNKSGSYDFQKYIHLTKPLMEIKKKINKKITLLEKSSTKRTSSGSNVYYDEYGSYDCPKNFLVIKPLKKIKNINKQNAHLENLTWRKCTPDRVYTMMGTAVMIVEKICFQ